MSCYSIYVHYVQHVHVKFGGNLGDQDSQAFIGTGNVVFLSHSIVAIYLTAVNPFSKLSISELEVRKNPVSYKHF